MNLLFGDYLAVLCAKTAAWIIAKFGLGAGGTWPGEIALLISPGLLSKLFKNLCGSVVVAGTNGKTTTSLIISQILKASGFKVVHNDSGANLLNGILSAIILNNTYNQTLPETYGVFEVDENTLPQLIANVHVSVVVLLNLFRDQLDRYGEVDVIIEKWQKALSKLPKNTTVILNADDPGIAALGQKLKCKKIYFGIEDKKLLNPSIQHAVDSVFCLKCGARLTFKGTFFSHLGHWSCGNCKLQRPKPQVSEGPAALPGIYNRYNFYAAAAAAKATGINDRVISETSKKISAAFGRQEDMNVSGKRVKLILSKNPTGFNESLRTALSMGAKNILFALNDRIPDGRDVSWIWDVDFEMLKDSHGLIVSGDRAYDLGVRLKYALESQISVEPDLKHAIELGLNKLNTNDILYILPTYSAMLEVRKILTGKKIL